jgi:sn-glycerol 3-phosphate transport system substrate-binding protein
MTGQTTIDVWFSDLTFPQYMDPLTRMSAEFEQAHPEYRINVRSSDFRALPSEVTNAVANGHRPAIVELYYTSTQLGMDLRRPGGGPLFTPVERAIGGRREILGEPVVIDDIISGVRDYFTYRTELVAMPTVATTPLLYTNLDLLHAAGVDRVPRTWEEIDAACDAIAGHPDGPASGITWANHGFFFQQALAQLGGLLADNDNGRTGRATTVTLHSDEMMTWVHWWHRLQRAGHFLYTRKIPDWPGNLKVFADQDVVFRISSSNDVNYMAQAAANGGFELAVSRFPYRAGSPYVGNIIAGTSLWLADGLDEATQDGALAFMQHLGNPRNDAVRHRFNSFIPITRAGFGLLERDGWFARHPHHRVACDQLNEYPDQGVARPPGSPESSGALFGDISGVQDVMTLAMHDVLIRDADPVERFTRATTQAQRLLDDYHADCADAGPGSPNSLRVEFFTGAEKYVGGHMDEVVQLERSTG